MECNAIPSYFCCICMWCSITLWQFAQITFGAVAIGNRSSFFSFSITLQAESANCRQRRSCHASNIPLGKRNLEKKKKWSEFKILFTIRCFYTHEGLSSYSTFRPRSVFQYLCIQANLIWCDGIFKTKNRLWNLTHVDIRPGFRHTFNFFAYNSVTLSSGCVNAIYLPAKKIMLIRMFSVLQKGVALSANPHTVFQLFVFEHFIGQTRYPHPPKKTHSAYC
jgi:hypothetical protein